MRICRSIVFAVLLALITPWACAEAPARSGYHEHFGCSTGPFKLTLPKTVSDLKKLGKAKELRDLNIEDHPGYSTAEHMLFLDGLDLRIITFSNDKRNFMPLVVSSYKAQWRVTGPFRVGDSLEHAHQLLGGKLVVKPGGAMEVGGDTDLLRLIIREGKIIRITYECSSG